MRSVERVETALRGGKPDRVPIVPIFDRSYMLRVLGLDERTKWSASPEQYADCNEQIFLRHDMDGMFVHEAIDRDWIEKHSIEKLEGYWLVTDTETGDKLRLLPDATWANEDGSPILEVGTGELDSRIRGQEDIHTLEARLPTSEEIELSGKYEPLRHLTNKYPDHHFSFQLATPMVYALQACGGYVQGLTTLATDPELFSRILAVTTRQALACIPAGVKAGARSALFTSYYTGADTISPKAYADLVFPFDYEICRSAREAGLFVLNWFLGDLYPILDRVCELPIDALVLEQGRKGYDIDPVFIRRRAGARLCIFGFGHELDYCEFRRRNLTRELERQIDGAGKDGAFIAGTPIMPPNANPDAVDFYFSEVRRLGSYL